MDSGLWMVEAAPSAALRPYVTRLVAYREGYDAPLERTEYPWTGVVLVFGFGAALECAGVQVTSFAAGLSDRPTHTRIRALTQGVEVFLTPFGARRLLGMPMSEVANRIVPVDDLFGRWGGAAVARLAEQPTWREQVRLVDRLLMERIHDAPELGPQVPWAWARLLESGGAVSVASLADALGWSHRHLVARFHDQVGLSPKAVARVVRFNRALSLLTPEVSLAELAAECGFYDQAHMNREFRALSGTTPGQIRPIAPYLDGATIDA
ncbi:helix-turn-helix domain-containing protein [Nonomuraea sp. NPDC050556]|uniref:helix-turn-helix domain-containing protein n=1 Tax=Nonomuraea sp. NPDC050556 TaxID=3364369 RepID=UPI003788488D